MGTILECTASGAGTCRNEDMILELIAERDEMSATVVKLSEQLGVALRERDAMREKVLRLRDACESVAQNMEASGKLWTPWHTSIAVARLRDALEMTAGK